MLRECVGVRLVSNRFNCACCTRKTPAKSGKIRVCRSGTPYEQDPKHEPSLSPRQLYSLDTVFAQQGAEAQDRSSTILRRTSPVILPPFALMHANIRQTMDTYSHVLPNMQQQAAERMDEMLG